MLCDRPGGLFHPRETLVPSLVQGVARIPYGCRLDDDASPHVVHGLGANRALKDFRQRMRSCNFAAGQIRKMVR